MPKSSLTVNAQPSFTHLKFPEGVKSVQIRNLDYFNTLWIADERNGLLDASGRWEIPPRSDAVLEVDPKKKASIYYVAHSARNNAATIQIEYTPFMFYGVRGILQGDMNPTRSYHQGFTYTAVNDNQNVAYNIATGYIAAMGGNRVRDIFLHCVTNGAIVGFDAREVLARGPPVVGTALLPGDILEISDWDLYASIDIMNLVAGQNTICRGMVAGD